MGMITRSSGQLVNSGKSDVDVVVVGAPTMLRQSKENVVAEGAANVTTAV